MSIFRLVLREIVHRKLSFGLGVMSVAVAIACLVAELALLHEHDRRTEQLVAAKEADTRQRMAGLEDDYRKITKQLGFNVLILPKDQLLSDLYADDFAARTMPEEYADRLARSGVATIQHLLPSLQRKLKWPERQRTVIVTGVRGEVPIAAGAGGSGGGPGNEKKPILNPVPPGSVVVGHELHRQFNLHPGEPVELLGRRFVVSRLMEERGTKDDITLWINLSEAQALFEQPGRINGILALECVCTAESLPLVRKEIAGILPDTQVIEFASQTLARAEARQRAALEARETVEREKQSRGDLRRQRESVAAVLVPLALLGAGVWVGLLALGNVRQRRPEIALFRALGLTERQVLSVFLVRAVVMGFAGGLAGFAIGAMVRVAWHEPRSGAAGASSPWWLPLLALGAAPLLAAGASWIPSLLALQQDPARILEEG